MSDQQQYKPSIIEAIDKLKYSDEFKAIVAFVKEMREETIADLGACRDPYDVMKLTGGAARLDELHAILNR